MASVTTVGTGMKKPSVNHKTSIGKSTNTNYRKKCDKKRGKKLYRGQGK